MNPMNEFGFQNPNSEPYNEDLSVILTFSQTRPGFYDQTKLLWPKETCMNQN